MKNLIELKRVLKEYGIETDLAKRWQEGIPHHPKSEELGRMLEALYWVFGGDAFVWKFGGDGDNGEHLLYELDIYFELKDCQNETRRIAKRDL